MLFLFFIFVCCCRTGTILYGKKIEMRSFLLIAYFFVATFMTHEQLIHEIDLSCESGTFKLSTGSKTSNQTVVFYHMIFRSAIINVISFFYLNFFRDIIAEHMFNNSQGYKIGGLGLTVEIDESMFGRFKLH